MTANIWIFKHDGTIQCDPNSIEETLAESRSRLEETIGATHVLRGEKRVRNVGAQCGLPTGNVNAFEITPEGWEKLQRGYVGALGFELWPPGEDFTYSKGKGELIGCTLRVYHTGDAITQDLRHDRANVELGPDERIVNVWIG